MKLLITETKLYLREWPSMLFSIGLPIALLVVLGLSIPAFTEAEAGGERFVDAQWPTMMMMLSLTTLACSILPSVTAGYREQGVLRRMSTTPVHPMRLLGAQLLIHLAVAIVSTIALIVVGRLLFGTAPPRQWAGFVLVFLLGSAALLALGLVIAALVPNGRVAPGIGSLVTFPLLFLAGVWVPREAMPDTLRMISDYSVVGPFAQALRDTWAGHAPQFMNLVVVAAGLVLFGGLAVRFFRWE